MKIAACVMALCAAVSIAGCSSSGSSGKAASGEVKETMRPYSVRQVVAADNEHGPHDHVADDKRERRQPRIQESGQQ